MINGLRIRFTINLQVSTPIFSCTALVTFGDKRLSDKVVSAVRFTSTVTFLYTHQCFSKDLLAAPGSPSAISSITCLSNCRIARKIQWFLWYFYQARDTCIETTPISVTQLHMRNKFGIHLWCQVSFASIICTSKWIHPHLCTRWMLSRCCFQSIHGILEGIIRLTCTTRLVNGLVMTFSSSFLVPFWLPRL